MSGDLMPGLDSLRAQRTRAQTRPTPMHPRVVEASSAPEPTTPDEPIRPAAPTSGKRVSSRSRSAAAPPVPRRRAGLAGSRRVVYLDPDQEEYIHQLEVAALIGRERIGASTILRAAVDELMATGKDWTALRPYVRRRGPVASE